MAAKAITSYPFKLSNLPSTPAATAGLALNPGSGVNQYTAWAQLFSAAQVTSEIQWLLLKIHSSALSAGTTLTSLDIGVDEAGGSSYTVKVQDFVITNAPSLIQAGAIELLVPIKIPSGSSVALRAYIGSSPANPIVIGYALGGSDFAPEGTAFNSFGASGNDGTSFTPGNNTWGSWVELGTTAQDLWFWQLGYRVDNSAITAEYTYIQLAWGDASTKNTILTYFHGGATTETIGSRVSVNLLPQNCFAEVPSGSKIYVRGWCNNAPDAGYKAMALGVGGVIPSQEPGGGESMSVYVN